PRVRDEVIVLQVAKERRQARDLANGCEFDAAANLLDGVAQRLRTVVGREADADRLVRDAAKLRRREWDAGTSKTYLAQSVMYTRNRQTTFLGTEDDDEDDF
ncbi:MAG: hypothetical protein ACKPBG_03255, partial [Actinomycetota bacterium]